MPEKFVNPYHFIPLGEKCDKTHDAENDRKTGNLTGWIDYTLETKTPLFIPNTTNDKAFNVSDISNIFVNDENNTDVENEMKRYEFFSYSNIKGNQEKCTAPVIPGSEIRGVIRSAYEAVTDSCLSTSDINMNFSRRHNDALKGYGFLFKNGFEWVIQPCDKYKISSRFKCETGQVIKFNPRIVGYNKYADNPSIGGRGIMSGVYYEGESIDNKKYESVFVKKNVVVVPVSEAEVEKYIESMRLYVKNECYSHLKWREYDINELGKCDYIPVYYESKKDASVQYLSPANIGRRVFNKKLKDAVGDYNPCESIKKCCPACSLFGMIGNDENSISGRLRFQDLSLSPDQQNVLFEKPVVLPELVSPKPSCFEFYFKKPDNCHYWDADQKTSYKAEIYKDKPTLSKPQSTNYDAEILGRKFYWHHKNVDLSKKVTATKRNVAVRPVDENRKFSGKIYFNNLNENELQRLLWVLTIGNSDSHGHKIGMGKPVGLGSIKKIDVTSINIKTLQTDSGSIEYLVKDNRNEYLSRVNNTEIKNKEAFCKLTGFNSKDIPVVYPHTDETMNESFKWFIDNRKGSVKTGQCVAQGDGMKPVVISDLTTCNLDNPVLMQQILKDTKAQKDSPKNDTQSGGRRNDKNQGSPFNNGAFSGLSKLKK